MNRENASVLDKRQVLIEGISYYFPEVNKKVENTEKGLIKVTLGSIIRIKSSSGIWYDIPCMKWILVPHMQDPELYKFYESYNKELYLHSKLYKLIEGREVKSKYQVSEQERLIQTYKKIK